ncbi:glycerol-3-phosphate dehydrogenase [Steroidobacter sp. S1-65]|uniref:Glycerol-3-phosphate dehydrogenase n=1 Tax=Steroidobacter gossypii TaxID=2805490 RepID=A0ABS1X1J7_9GAMM|nr:glycerol-3-phosphate dehydrogenase [Steroidobacter gossypii]MBM0107098.1 glycerol-3-phosphate dehydrogenase [Steroidobacter gossypii]
MTAARADGPSVDLLIVGGGINGAGIARDAAGRGLKVMLVEQADLASATSSASTKLIHGGLRYLEFFEFRLVREALLERERLLRIAPHIIRPMEFILPHVPELRPRWLMRLGLFFYDHIGGREILPASRNVRLANGAYGPLRAGLDHGFAYSDCWVDDSRLVVLNALDAALRGASIRTRTRFVSARVEGSQWLASIQDLPSSEITQVRARAIVNAAGPWVQRVLQSFPEMDVDAQVRLVKGSHIVVPRLFDGEHAFMLQNPDGRIVFAIPYQQQFTLVGTTDVPFDGDATQVSISNDEVLYLCSTVNSYFRKHIAPADVKWSYAGVRPLSDDETENASKVTRDYRLELTETDNDAPPLLSVFGGKITTYRRLAESALSKLQLRGNDREWTDRAALPGGDLPRADFATFADGVQKRWPFLSAAMAHRLAQAYGTRVEKILGKAQAMLDLGEHYGGGLTQAELDYLVANEWARSADDVLWRRSKLGLHLSEQERGRVAEWFKSQPT